MYSIYYGHNSVRASKPLCAYLRVRVDDMVARATAVSTAPSRRRSSVGRQTSGHSRPCTIARPMCEGRESASVATGDVTLQISRPSGGEC
jgi:hypothetical protein